MLILAGKSKSVIAPILLATLAALRLMAAMRILNPESTFIDFRVYIARVAVVTRHTIILLLFMVATVTRFFTVRSSQALNYWKIQQS